jgi:hypothetical protein
MPVEFELLPAENGVAEALSHVNVGTLVMAAIAGGALGVVF